MTDEKITIGYQTELLLLHEVSEALIVEAIISDLVPLSISPMEVGRIKEGITQAIKEHQWPRDYAHPPDVFLRMMYNAEESKDPQSYMYTSLNGMYIASRLSTKEMVAKWVKRIVVSEDNVRSMLDLYQVLYCIGANISESFRLFETNLQKFLSVDYTPRASKNAYDR